MSDDFKKLSEDELMKAAGGVDGKVGLDPDGPWKTVSGLERGWLALRSDFTYDYSNEIGQLSNGMKVQVIGNGAEGKDRRSYTWVYSPDLNKSGWVNSDFIK